MLMVEFQESAGSHGALASRPDRNSVCVVSHIVHWVTHVYVNELHVTSALCVSVFVFVCVWVWVCVNTSIYFPLSNWAQSWAGITVADCTSFPAKDQTIHQIFAPEQMDHDTRVPCLAMSAARCSSSIVFRPLSLIILRNSSVTCDI